MWLSFLTVKFVKLNLMIFLIREIRAIRGEKTSLARFCKQEHIKLWEINYPGKT